MYIYIGTIQRFLHFEQCMQQFLVHVCKLFIYNNSSPTKTHKKIMHRIDVIQSRQLLSILYEIWKCFLGVSEYE